MTNVIDITERLKQRSTDGAFDEVAALTRETLEAIFEHFRKGLWSRVTSSPLAVTLTDWSWACMEVNNRRLPKDSSNPYVGAEYTIGSAVRSRVFPEFGHKANRTFLTMQIRHLDSQIKSVFVSEDKKRAILTDLHSYAVSFPETNSTYYEFQMAVLSGLMELGPIHHIGSELEDDKLEITLSIPAPEDAPLTRREVRLKFDFLPFVLDDAAIRMAAEESSS